MPHGSANFLRKRLDGKLPSLKDVLFIYIEAGQATLVAQPLCLVLVLPREVLVVVDVRIGDPCVVRTLQDGVRQGFGSKNHIVDEFSPAAPVELCQQCLYGRPSAAGHAVLVAVRDAHSVAHGRRFVFIRRFVVRRHTVGDRRVIVVRIIELDHVARHTFGDGLDQQRRPHDLLRHRISSHGRTRID